VSKRHAAQRSSARKAKLGLSYVTRSQPVPSNVFDTYWKFAAERQAIFVRRLAGALTPWTTDPVLQTYKFTNVYRASDRTSQYLIRNIIYSVDTDAENAFFRILLFKIFNKIETWELLKKAHGEPCLGDFDPNKYDRTLTLAMEQGRSIYSAAYIMPSGSADTRQSRKHRTHMLLLIQMSKDKLFAKLAQIGTMKAGYLLLSAYPGLGPFLSYQFVTDINYSSFLRLSEMEFVVPGPGARDGLRKCFKSFGDYSEEDVIQWVAERQDQEFADRGLEFHRLGKRGLQLIDCQNVFCEVDKYARVVHPEAVGLTGRVRIKQKFHSNGPIPAPFYPPFWTINDTAVCRRPRPLQQIALL
jgi:hypothetical protein